MDDMILLDPSRNQLILWRENIKDFLENKLKLKLHPKKQVLQSTEKGINFCGYIVRPEYTLIRRRTVKKLKNTLWRFNRKILESIDPESPSNAENILFNDPFIVFEKARLADDFRHILSSINSVYGFFKHADCGDLRKTLYEKHFGILKIYLRPANREHSYFVWKEPY